MSIQHIKELVMSNVNVAIATYCKTDALLSNAHCHLGMNSPVLNS